MIKKNVCGCNSNYYSYYSYYYILYVEYILNKNLIKLKKTNVKRNHCQANIHLHSLLCVDRDQREEEQKRM